MRGRSLRIVSLVAVLFAGVASSVVACSSFDEAEPTPAPDASSDSSTGTSDAPADAAAEASTDGAPTRCSHDAPFTSFRPLDGVNSPGLEFHPRLTNDELVIYFGRQPTASDTYTTYRAERAKRTDAFSAPEVVPGVPIGVGRVQPFIGELEVVYMDFSDVNNRIITRARRASKLDPFEVGARDPLESDLEDRDFPFYSKDGREALYVVYTTASGADLGRATLDGDGGIVTSAIVDTLNTTSSESDVVLSIDGLAVYFYSDRSTTVGHGSTFVAQRDTPTSNFRTPRRIEELVPDAGAYTAPGFVSEDGCRLYYYGDPFPGTASDLFIAERLPK